MTVSRMLSEGSATNGSDDPPLRGTNDIGCVTISSVPCGVVVPVAVRKFSVVLESMTETALLKVLSIKYAGCLKGVLTG